MLGCGGKWKNMGEEVWGEVRREVRVVVWGSVGGGEERYEGMGKSGEVWEEVWESVLRRGGR